MSNNPWELPPPEQNNSDAWALPPVPSPAPAKKKRLGTTGKVLVLVAVAVLIIGGGTVAYFATGGGKNLAAMSYISSEDPGPNPFMDSTVNQDAAASPDNPNLVGTSAQGAVAGDDPNIYGGTGELSVCDAAALVSNLQNNSDLNAAFAEGIGINAADVPRYVTSLAPVILRQDTWVTNHGYDNGHPVPFQAVLQRGTAVMVDARGVPRVRCSCGNPLAEAWNCYTAPETDKANWDGYEPRNVVTIYQTDVTINTINVINVDNGVSNEIGIADDDSATQQQVLDAVTDDTPVTTPKDMGVRPDGDLLGELGLTEADGDSEERPTGGDRFSDYQQWAETGFGGAGEKPMGSNFPDWRSQTTEVEASEFKTDAVGTFGSHFVPAHNHGVGCIINTEDSTIDCYIDSLENTGIEKPYDDFYPEAAGNNSKEYPVNFLSIHSTSESFHPLAMMVESPLVGLAPLPRLEPGQSVSVGEYSCFNLEDSMGCESPNSKFYIDSAGRVFIDGSDTPLGS